MNEPVVVSKNAGLIDGLQAAGRYILFLVTAFTAIIGLLKVHDIAGLIAYIQANGGQVIASISGLIALAIAAYGTFKTAKRGSQLETAAVDPANENVVLKGE